MPGDELYSVIHVPGLKDENAAELLLGFRRGTIRSFWRLKRFSTSPTLRHISARAECAR
jgi:hypothetical protein